MQNGWVLVEEEYFAGSHDGIIERTETVAANGPAFRTPTLIGGFAVRHIDIGFRQSITV